MNMNMKIVADAKATLTLFPRKSSAWLKLLHHSIIAHVHELEEANTRELERLIPRSLQSGDKYKAELYDWSIRCVL